MFYLSRRSHLGAKGVRAPEDRFYGDRTSYVIDPYGHSTYVSKEEMQKAMSAANAKET
jgi:uncharacterized glyoxalase superfamily protein PhnB